MFTFDNFAMTFVIALIVISRLSFLSAILAGRSNRGFVRAGRDKSSSNAAFAVVSEFTRKLTPRPVS